MQQRFLKYMKNQKNSFIYLVVILLSISCTTKKEISKKDSIFTTADNYDFNKKIKAQCTPKDNFVIYELGDTPCWKYFLQINKNESLKIDFKVTNKNSKDLYEHGYQELARYKNGKLVETMKLRKDEDAYWNEVPFVRIRKQAYLADLDNDGYLEFAVFPFSSGSAIWGTVRIYSLKDKIEFWGEGRYQFEGDTFVQLNCMRCSKFNPDECKKCR